MLQVSTWFPVRVLTRMGSQRVMDTIIMNGNTVRTDMVILMKWVKLLTLLNMWKLLKQFKLVKLV